MAPNAPSRLQASLCGLSVSKTGLGFSILSFLGGLYWHLQVVSTIHQTSDDFAMLATFAVASLALLLRSFFPKMSISAGMVTYFGGFLLGRFVTSSHWTEHVSALFLGAVLTFIGFFGFPKIVWSQTGKDLDTVLADARPREVPRVHMLALLLFISLLLALWQAYTLIFNWTFRGAQFIPASLLILFAALAGISGLTIIDRVGFRQDTLLRWLAAFGFSIGLAVLCTQVSKIRSITLVSTTLNPVVKSLESLYSQHGYLPFMILDHLKPITPVPQILPVEYRTDGICFALGTRGGSLDIEGGRVYYDSGIKRWKTDTRLRSIGYSCDRGPLSPIKSHYYWDGSGKGWSVPFAAAVDQEMVGAKATLGAWFFNKNEYSSALPLLKDAADAGEKDSMEMMGDIYFNGWGTSRDFRQAIQWYQKCAGLRRPSASRKLGQMYLLGLGVMGNRSEAVKYLGLAAKEGDIIAQQELTRIGQ